MRCAGIMYAQAKVGNGEIGVGRGAGSPPRPLGLEAREFGTSCSFNMKLPRAHAASLLPDRRNAAPRSIASGRFRHGQALSVR